MVDFSLNHEQERLVMEVRDLASVYILPVA